MGGQTSRNGVGGAGEFREDKGRTIVEKRLIKLLFIINCPVPGQFSVSLQNLKIGIRIRKKALQPVR